MFCVLGLWYVAAGGDQAEGSYRAGDTAAPAGRAARRFGSPAAAPGRAGVAPGVGGVQRRAPTGSLQGAARGGLVLPTDAPPTGAVAVRPGDKPVLRRQPVGASG